ncbi:FIG00921845: hypothetical protein [hydrothermal vent metagenome]|uniref:YtkA-like domain-containing protein n=1 Tax=hydrothermal vent metagenome TaxID=652676 RepID=A0A3B0XAP2_9ZZZZ
MKRFKKGDNTIKTGAVISVLFILLSVSVGAYAHHVLGRPAYSLNEDSNTPPSMQVETQIGEYFLTYMVFPAFPKPGENGRINVYASRIDNGDTFQGEMSFSVRNDNWFGDKNEESVGTQNVDDGVYRQGFLFKEKGNYIITAKFTSGGEPYIIDFPLQIGESSSMLPVGIALGSIVFVLITVNIIQRKRLMREKIRAARNEPE